MEGSKEANADAGLIWGENKADTRVNKRAKLEEPDEGLICGESEADARINKRAKLEEPDERMLDPRRHLTMLVMGPSGSGKSTIVGQILVLTGQVSVEELQALEELAISNDREGRHLAYIMDIDDSERLSGTKELGSANVEIRRRSYTILDAPGYKCGLPELISGAYEADFAVMVISASDGEFEQALSSLTQEQVLLASSFGIEKLIVLVNKMDSVMWSKARFEEIEEKFSSFLFHKNNFLTENVFFLPVAGLNGNNIETCQNGRSFFDVLETMDLVPRGNDSASFRMPIIEVHNNDDGTLLIVGRICSGIIKKHDNFVIMPTQEHSTVLALYCCNGNEGQEINQAGTGDYVRIHIVTPHNHIRTGFVVSSGESLSTKCFSAELRFLKPPPGLIYCAGFQAILHIHSLVVECTIVELKQFTTDGCWSKKMFLKEGDFAMCRVEVPEHHISIEEAASFPQLGEFVLRTRDITVAVGNVISWDDGVMAGV